jgi:hypothetical protein
MASRVVQSCACYEKHAATMASTKSGVKSEKAANSTPAPKTRAINLTVIICQIPVDLAEDGGPGLFPDDFAVPAKWFRECIGGWYAEARSFGPALPFGSEKAVTEIQAVRHWEEQDEQASSAKHKQWLEQFAVVER